MHEESVKVLSLPLGYEIMSGTTILLILLMLTGSEVLRVAHMAVDCLRSSTIVLI